MSQITQQVENGTLPNMAENLLSSSHLHKETEQKATSDTKSLLSTPSDTARHKRVPCCNSVGEDGENAQTNRKAQAKDQQCAVTGRTVKRHLAAVDEGMKATTVSFPELPTIQPVNHVLLYNFIPRPHPDFVYHWPTLAKYYRECLGHRVHIIYSPLLVHDVGVLPDFLHSCKLKIWEWPGYFLQTHPSTYSHVICFTAEPESESELYQQSHKKLKDDDFFL